MQTSLKIEGWLTELQCRLVNKCAKKRRVYVLRETVAGLLLKEEWRINLRTNYLPSLLTLSTFYSASFIQVFISLRSFSLSISLFLSLYLFLSLFLDLQIVWCGYDQREVGNISSNKPPQLKYIFSFSYFTKRTFILSFFDSLFTLFCLNIFLLFSRSLFLSLSLLPSLSLSYLSLSISVKAYIPLILIHKLLQYPPYIYLSINFSPLSLITALFEGQMCGLMVG